MCQAFSFIFTRHGALLSLPTNHSHSAIAEHYGLADGSTDPSFIRIEMDPDHHLRTLMEQGHYFTPEEFCKPVTRLLEPYEFDRDLSACRRWGLTVRPEVTLWDRWNFRIDEQTLPTWVRPDHLNEIVRLVQQQIRSRIVFPDAPHDLSQPYNTEGHRKSYFGQTLLILPHCNIEKIAHCYLPFVISHCRIQYLHMSEVAEIKGSRVANIHFSRVTYVSDSIMRSVEHSNLCNTCRTSMADVEGSLIGTLEADSSLNRMSYSRVVTMRSSSISHIKPTYAPDVENDDCSLPKGMKNTRLFSFPRKRSRRIPPHTYRSSFSELYRLHGAATERILETLEKNSKIARPVEEEVTA